jgi:hypothetical protein
MSLFGFTVPKRMLKPCANINILPFVMEGSISLYTAGAVVSGTRIITTSAHLAASAGVTTASPWLSALLFDLLSAARPTFT